MNIFLVTEELSSAILKLLKDKDLRTQLSKKHFTAGTEVLLEENCGEDGGNL